ncbi:vacuolar protein 8 [Pisolithus croceorrhizus]|nr:vacuolar protein 8 [Pisolithus croceorrhizus]
MKTALEYSASAAETSFTPSSTEFFSCLVAQPPLISDLNIECTPPALLTADENDSVNVNRTNVREDSLPTDLLDSERDAVADLQYLENRTTTNLFQGSPLAALTTLSFSDNVDLQRSAALAFAEITEKEVRPIGRDILDPIIFLLSSQDTETQLVASAAFGNLAVDRKNKLIIVKLGALDPLIYQMRSSDVEVQCNAVGCITNLATHEESRIKIANSGVLVPLTQLACSEDVWIQRNATGVLLIMTHSDENRQRLVNAGAIPVLVSLLNSVDTDVQYRCTAALNNSAADNANRKKLAQTEPQLVSSLVALMDSPSLRVQCQATLALRNLASDEKYQAEIVKVDGLTPLSPAACVRNVSILPQNDSPITESGLLQPIVSLLSFEDSVEVPCHAIPVLRNFAASSDKNKTTIVEAGVAQTIKELVLEMPMDVQSEMIACIAVLALSNELKGRLLEMGICEVLIPLTNSPNPEVRGNSAAALGNLSSKGKHGRWQGEWTASNDYSAFNDVWDKPDGGLHRYLYKFLTSLDATFQHIAVWAIMQLLESGEHPEFEPMSPTPSLTASPGTSPSHYSQTRPYQDTDAEDENGGIQLLARRILEIVYR